MHRFGFWFDVIIKDDERGFLSRDGRFVRLLAPGRFTSFDPGRQLSVEVVKAVRTELTPERALLLHRTHRPVAEQNFEIVQTSPTEVAIVSFDGEAKHLVPPNTTRAFWKALTSVDVELIDTETELRVAKRYLDKLDPLRSGNVLAFAVVEAYEAGLLIVDGELKERTRRGATPSGRSAAR